MVKAPTKKNAAKSSSKATKASSKTSAKKSPKKATAKKPVKKTVASKKDDPATTEVEEVVQVDRRAGERRDPESSVEVPAERRKVSRRRQIDPTTCERDYSDSEIEFMQAMDAYKRSSGRMFPTCSEILEVIRGLGYCRPGEELVVPSAPGFGDDEDDSASDAGIDSDFDIE